MFLFGCVIFVLLAITLIKPWLHGKALRELKDEVASLQRRVDAFEAKNQPLETYSPQDDLQIKSPASDRLTPAVPLVIQEAPTAAIEDEEALYESFDEAPVIPEPSPEPAFNFEQQFGARLPVWIGGISLALAGFFMVKYSIENNLVSPTVRVFFAFLLGLGLLGGGGWMFKRPTLANSARICQALTGAGIVCLYGAFFAAGTLYHLVSPAVSFAGMAGITVIAVFLSIAQGPAVAIFGMVGGFLTPILVSSDRPNTILLVCYLSILSYGLLYLARRQNWLWLSMPVYAFSLGWALLWVGLGWKPEESIWVSLYVVGLLFISPFILLSNTSDEKIEVNHGIRISALSSSVAALFILSTLMAKAEFTSLHWSTFGLAGLASMILAVFRPRLYAFTPVLCAAVTTVMLLFWEATNPVDFLQTASLFAGVYFLAGLAFMFRSPSPLWWSLLAILAMPLLFVMSSFKQDRFFDSLAPVGLPFLCWCALGVSAISIALTTQIQKRFPEAFAYKQHLVSLAAFMGVGFLSWGLYLAIDPQYLMLAYALQLLGIAWLLRTYQFSFLRQSFFIAAALTALSLAIHLEELCNLIIVRDFGRVHSGYVTGFPLLQLSGVAALVLATAALLRNSLEKKAAFICAALLGLGVTFAGMHYVAATHLQPELTYAVRVLSLNFVWLAALAILYMSVRSPRPALLYAAKGLLIYAVGETAIDLLAFFPGRSTDVGALPLLNLLIPAFALPALYMYLAARDFPGIEKRMARVLQIAALGYAFLFVSLEVNQYYSGGHLFAGVQSVAETYTYSVVWLVYGLALLLAGTLRKSKLCRVAALCVITGTVCKVFLYDASELDGILRVLSFLGLGVSLLGLSYFYTRFVAKDDQ